MDGIKSKDRVKEHGEVFTPDTLVNDMLDLVEEGINTEELWKFIDTTYLEPSCGNGNFLLRILDRKLEAVQKLSNEQWVIGLVHSLCSIYAIDIQEDNVVESKERLKNLIFNGNVELLDIKDANTPGFHFKKYTSTPELDKVINFILDNNIICGSSLDGSQYAHGKSTGKDIDIIEYIWDGNNVTCIQNIFNSMVEGSIFYGLEGKKLGTIDYMKLYTIKDSGTMESNEDRLEF